MSECVGIHDLNGESIKYGMTKNKEIIVVQERNLISCKDAFNIFWKANVNILYVVDDTDCFVGIITNRSLLKQVRENEQGKPFINKMCSVLNNKEDRRLFAEAEQLFEKYHITTAIPVIDEDRKICFEIRKNGLNEEKKIIVEFCDKIKKYENSYYLKEEIICLRKLLESQDIVVIGTEERFDNIFGCLHVCKRRIHYMKEPDHVYEFMNENEYLMIDVSPSGYRGREDIYRYCNNGYLWNQFIVLLYKAIELEYCSKLYQVLDNKYVTLKDFLNEYMVREVFISKRSIFTALILEYLQRFHFNVIEQKGVYREEFQYDIEMNGIHLDRRAWSNDEYITIDCVNLILQLYLLNKKLSDKVRILSFEFCEKLEALEAEQIRMGGTSLKDASECELLYTLGNNKDKKYLLELEDSLRFDAVRSFENDRIVFKDVDSEMVCIENGIRRTCHQPEKYVGTIYFLGGCTIWGASADDECTIPSFIQEKMNQSGKKYRAVNLANNLMNASRLLEALDIKKDDIFVILFPFITKYVKENISIMEIGEQFNKLRREKYHGVECFCNMVQHCGINGNIIYSEIIFHELKKYLLDIPDNGRHFLKNHPHTMFHTNYKDLDVLYGYESFVAELQKKKGECVIGRNGKVGCIVMNCNPFTSGHRYLVEYALSKVDCLFLFVVEEDKSFFSFTDRYEMVRRGTEDLENVAVIRSGNMIVTAVTFAVYFNREKNVSLSKIDSVSMDLRIFGQYIAPAVNIEYRFVGEEPIDPVTAKYNLKMKEILPEFGVQVIEIPRKCQLGNVISASRVRELYKENDFESMKALVPETTLQYLIEKKNGYEE